MTDVVLGLQAQINGLRAEVERLRAELRECEGLYAAAAERCNGAEAENERLREHLAQIAAWAKAYPETVFPMPDLKRAQELLQAGGMTLDAISAHAMRHVVEGVGAIARCGLEQRVAAIEDYLAPLRSEAAR